MGKPNLKKFGYEYFYKNAVALKGCRHNIVSNLTLRHILLIYKIDQMRCLTSVNPVLPSNLG